jgi:hypothetical protein
MPWNQRTLTCLCVVLLACGSACGAGAAVRVHGEMKTWHTITLDLSGPQADERQTPNPFTDLRLSITFRHPERQQPLVVPGYFAADGDAARTSAAAGNIWRAHLMPDRTGEWSYEVAFHRGPRVAIDHEAAAEPVAPLHGLKGAFTVGPSDKTGRDLRAHGLLQYVGKHHYRFAGSGRWLLKFGPDSPETLLAFAGFDGTVANKPGKAPLKHYAAHLRDWREGDPQWTSPEQSGDSRGLIGALNYLADSGCNAISFLTYNVGGDGDNVWPMIAPDQRLRYDCSKLDQWHLVFQHAQAQGLMLHIKLQETENDSKTPASLDGGATGDQRRLYLRELVARFAHLPAIEWNIGEENDQTTEQQLAMMRHLAELDPYDHPIVIHTYPDQQDKVYPKLLGDRSPLAGTSLQNGWKSTHERTLHWIAASAAAGRPWVCANDEQGPASHGVPPDPGYAGFSGRTRDGYDLHDIRRQVLWGNLIAGGAGVMYYFGYQLPQNDIVAEDFRSRDQSWSYGRIALELFHRESIPFHDMASADDMLHTDSTTGTQPHCLAQAGQIYLIYLPGGGPTSIDLASAAGEFELRWFDPRAGGALRSGDVTTLAGGGRRSLGSPPAQGAAGDDWVALLRRQP